jgi:hypothetical protein
VDTSVFAAVGSHEGPEGEALAHADTVDALVATTQTKPPNRRRCRLMPVASAGRR